MSIRRIMAIVIRHMYLWPKSFERLMGTLGWPFLELTIWGLTMTYLQSNLMNSVSLVTVFLGALIFWQFITRTETETALNFLEEVWNKNLINIFASPLTKAEFLTSTIISNLIKLFLTATMLTTVAWFFYHFNIIKTFGLYIPFLLVNLFLVGWTVSFFVIAMVLRFGYKAQELAWAITLVVQPFSAVFYPVSALPDWAQKIARFFPSSYVFEEMRHFLYEGKLNEINLLIAFILNIIYLFLSIWFFSAMFEKARELGKLVKLN